MRPHESACPQCGAPPGCLSVDEDALWAKPLGTYSIPGHQMKVAAEWAPKLSCIGCDMIARGYPDPDGRHWNFVLQPPGTTTYTPQESS